ncbi:MAG: class I SAM-dependent methyltransferase [Acidimicrobiia bacterium]|nr:MAG: class I SAM-dependent methyltransferase [Acidimicrobiia bacterium]
MTRRSFLPDDRLTAYIAGHTAAPSDLEQALIDETGELAEAGMQIGPEQAEFLRFLVRISGARAILEIGSFTGYSALAMASALPEGGSVVALDASEVWTNVARRYWEQAGLADRIDLRIGPAVESLAAMVEEPTFDLVFIDADKTGYPEYLSLVVPRLKSGGIVVADNTLRSGRVADPSDTSESIDAVRRFNRAAADDDRLDTQLLPLFDGLTIAVRR